MGRTPYRLHLEDLVYLLSSLSRHDKRALLSDAIVILSSLNVIAGELDIILRLMIVQLVDDF
jgi:NADH:ubiquinone oxidoreductase subunit D